MNREDRAEIQEMIWEAMDEHFSYGKCLACGQVTLHIPFTTSGSEIEHCKERSMQLRRCQNCLAVSEQVWKLVSLDAPVPTEVGDGFD